MMTEKDSKGDINITNNFNAPIGQHIDHVDTINFRMDGEGTFHFGMVEKANATAGIPSELDTEEARRLWAAARDAGWVDDDCHPRLSRALSAMLADRMATILEIPNKWKVFETFWGMNSLRSAYNHALDQKQFNEFHERLKKIIR